MVRIASIGLLLVLSSTALADGKRGPKPVEPPPEDMPTSQDPNQCAKVSAHARYVGMGYTHSVELRNGCARRVACTLWTDIDPEPKQTVVVTPGDSGEVVTRRGSPSQEVTGFKDCTFR